METKQKHKLLILLELYRYGKEVVQSVVNTIPGLSLEEKIELCNSVAANKKLSNALTNWINLDLKKKSIESQADTCIACWDKPLGQKLYGKIRLEKLSLEYLLKFYKLDWSKHSPSKTEHFVKPISQAFQKTSAEEVDAFVDELCEAMTLDSGRQEADFLSVGFAAGVIPEERMRAIITTKTEDKTYYEGVHTSTSEVHRMSLIVGYIRSKTTTVDDTLKRLKEWDNLLGKMHIDAIGVLGKEKVSCLDDILKIKKFLVELNENGFPTYAFEKILAKLFADTSISYEEKHAFCMEMKNTEIWTQLVKHGKLKNEQLEQCIVDSKAWRSDFIGVLVPYLEQMDLEMFMTSYEVLVSSQSKDRFAEGVKTPYKDEFKKRFNETPILDFMRYMHGTYTQSRHGKQVTDAFKVYLDQLSDVVEIGKVLCEQYDRYLIDCNKENRRFNHYELTKYYQNVYFKPAEPVFLGYALEFLLPEQAEKLCWAFFTKEAVTAIFKEPILKHERILELCEECFKTKTHSFDKQTLFYQCAASVLPFETVAKHLGANVASATKQ